MFTSIEISIIHLIHEGMTSKEIGKVLYYSPRTIEGKIESLCFKMDCKNKFELSAKTAKLLITNPEYFKIQ